MWMKCSGFRRRLGPCLLVVYSACSLLSSAGLASAGQAGDATILGQVTDESGAVLPGVTVTASSPALQIAEVNIVTNERGEYRLTPLPIGTYTVTYTLSGFRTIKREDIRLTSGFSAKLDVQLKVGGLEETLTVSGASPVVDVTSTATTTQLTRETLELTPTGRNGIVALIAQAPGVRSNVIDVGGSSMNQTVTFRTYGQQGQSWQTLDGVMTTSPKDGQSGNYYDYSSFEEADIKAIGKTAEAPNRGVQMNVVVKSGSNDLHGTYFYGQTGKALQSKSSASTATQGTDAVRDRRDVSGDLGGRIVLNKLWFYVGGRNRTDNSDVLVDTALRAANGYGFLNDEPNLHRQHQAFQNYKLSYQMSKSNKLVGFYNWQLKKEDRTVSTFIPWESRTDEDFRAYTGKVEWQAVHGSSLVTSLQYGYWKWHADYAATSPNVSILDLVTNFRTGDNTSSGNTPGEWRHHTTGSVSWYRPDMWRGNHDFKAGFDWMASTISRSWISRASGNYQLDFRSGVPNQVETYNYPVVPVTQSHYLGTYVRDNWTIARRLTLSLGVRYAHDLGFIATQCRVDAVPTAFGPAQCFDPVDFNTWNPISPRIAASYDVAGDGKTVIKGGWGRFDHMRQIDEVLPANLNIAATTIWRWHDNNGNNRYDPGEVNLDPNGPDFINRTARDSGLFSNGIKNPNEKEPYENQYNVSIEREIMPNFGVRVSGVYTKNANVYRILNVKRPYGAYNVAVTVPDPGPDGLLGTADDPGKNITFYDFPASLSGIANQVPELINDPGSTGRYKTIELGAVKRLSNRWQFLASYSATKLNEPFQELSNFNPAAEQMSGNGGAAPQNYWEWVGGLSGTYVFPYDISLAANYRHGSGTPQARTLSLKAPQSGTIVINAEPIGSIRLPNINLVDFRLEKSFRLLNNHKIAARLNVYNVMNVNTVTARSVLSGVSYLQPLVGGQTPATLLPRIFELAASYSF